MTGNRLFNMPAPGADWENRAACKDRGDEMFDTTPMGVRRAAAVCAECPVLSECWELSEQFRPQFGVWAGRRWWLHRGPQDVDIWCSVPGCMELVRYLGMCSRCVQRTRLQQARAAS